MLRIPRRRMLALYPSRRVVIEAGDEDEDAVGAGVAEVVVAEGAAKRSRIR